MEVQQWQCMFFMGQLHMRMLSCKARALDMHKATSTFFKHVLVPVNLQHIVLYNTSTYLSIAIPISYHGYIHIYVPVICHWKNSNGCLDLAIWFAIRVSMSSGSAVVTRFQS